MTTPPPQQPPGQSEPPPQHPQQVQYPPQQGYPGGPYAQQGNRPPPGYGPPPGYAPQPGYGYPQVPPKKKSKVGLILGIIGGVLVLFILLAMCTSGGDDKDSTSGSGSDDSAVGIGQPIKGDQFEYTVLSVEDNVQIADGFWSKPAQGRYLAVLVKVKNVSNKAETFWTTQQKLIDTQGREFEHNFDAELDYNRATGGVDFSEPINPGNEKQVAIVYDVSVDAQPAAIKLTESAFGDPVTVNLK